MALWKPLRGNRTALNTVEKHDGWIYFCTDDGSLFFDYTDADGNLQRKQINAKDAETLCGVSLDELKNEITTQDAVILHEAQTYTDAALEKATNQDAVILHEAQAYTDSLVGADGKSDYDVVITTEEEFKKCVYMLHPNKNEDGSVDLTTYGEPDSDFYYRYILVRDIDFTEDLGSSDLNLAVLQPSIRYIKFDNCQWHCRWYLSGEKPTILNSNKTGYEKAEGSFNVILDGITIDEENVTDSIAVTTNNPDDRYYVGLRNFERIENCYIHYPSGYNLIKKSENDYKYSFKFNLQYFTAVQNCKVTALWDGQNISGCSVTEKIVRCSNIVNISADSLLAENNPVEVDINDSKNISNVTGSYITYTNCKNVDFSTCDGYPYSLPNGEFDLIITSGSELVSLEDRTDITTVLVKSFSLTSKKLVPGFFADNDGGSDKYRAFKIPENVKYIKFDKSFSYDVDRVFIQGHPSCIIDGFPTATAPYSFAHNITLYDFKEVRNCYARINEELNQNGIFVTENSTVGISNIIVAETTGYDGYVASPIESLYNFKGTKFINSDIFAIENAEYIENCRVIANDRVSNYYIKNVKSINGLSILNIPTNSNFQIINCSNLNNIRKNGFSVSYSNCRYDLYKNEVDYSYKNDEKIEFDLVITTKEDLNNLPNITNSKIKTVLVRDLSISNYSVKGFFKAETTAINSPYIGKFKIPENIEYIKFDSSFSYDTQVVAIEGHQNCILDGLPLRDLTVNYRNITLVYGFKEVRNCLWKNNKKFNSEGKFSTNINAVGISNKINIKGTDFWNSEFNLSLVEPSATIVNTNTKFVNCAISYINGAKSLEDCIVVNHSSMSSAYIKNVSSINNLTVGYLPSNKILTIENCKNILGIHENDYTVDYKNCGDLNSNGAIKEYVDEAVANVNVDLTGYATEEWVEDTYGYKIIQADSRALLEVFEGGSSSDEYRYFPDESFNIQSPYHRAYILAEELHSLGDTINVPKIEVKTEDEYNALPVKDETTIYIIKE